MGPLSSPVRGVLMPRPIRIRPVAYLLESPPEPPACDNTQLERDHVTGYACSGFASLLTLPPSMVRPVNPSPAVLYTPGDNGKFLGMYDFSRPNYAGSGQAFSI